jgi:small subunit ribosomal protein S8
MSMTDPIADFLTRVRNAIHGRKPTVSIPASNLKKRIAEIMKKEGFIEDIRFLSDKRQGVLELELKYDERNESAILGLQRISRPGQRKYVKKDEIPRVRNGLGVAILTTSRGVVTDREADRLAVGGEVICAIW